MASKKEYLAQLKGDWTAGEIHVTYRRRMKPRIPIHTSQAAYDLFYTLWDKELITLQEQMWVIFLNRPGDVIGYRLLNTGSMVRCDIDIRLLVSLALHCMASSVVIAHNHPSGNLDVSNRDKDLTNNISRALGLIDVLLHDHLIITADSWMSMAVEGML